MDIEENDYGGNSGPRPERTPSYDLVFQKNNPLFKLKPFLYFFFDGGRIRKSTHLPTAQIRTFGAASLFAIGTSIEPKIQIRANFDSDSWAQTPVSDANTNHYLEPSTLLNMIEAFSSDLSRLLSSSEAWFFALHHGMVVLIEIKAILIGALGRNSLVRSHPKSEIEKEVRDS